MDFKKLQEMQQALDNAILADKPKMSAEELFNKTLVALNVELAEVANCSEHFKHCKINKGKVDYERFFVYHKDSEKSSLVGYKFDRVNSIQVTNEQAHQLTLIEEAADCLHFILSLANQSNFEINDSFIDCEVDFNGNEKEELYLEVVYHIARISRRSTLIVPAFKNLISDFMTYVSLLGIVTQELEQAYYDKNEVNYQRLQDGY